MRLASCLVLPAALIAATLSLPVQAQEFQFNLEQALTSAEIQAGGVKIQLSDGTSVEIISVTPPQGRADCLVHVPSLRMAIETGLRAGTLRPIGMATQQLTLQLKQDPRTGALWCGGAGTGCTIVVK